MSDVISLAEKKFYKVNAGKILNACDLLDQEVHRLLYTENVPADELIPALCARIGTYLSYTDADRERVIKKLAKIIYKYAKTSPP